MLASLRQRVLSTVFGGGFTGAIAASLASWLGAQVGSAIRREPQVIDTSRIEPGQTYVVSTRPAPNRVERRARTQALKVASQLDAEIAPTRAERSVARALARARRKATRAPEGSSRRRRHQRSVADLEAQLARLRAPSRRAVRLRRKLEMLEATAERERSAALAKASKKHGAPLERTFR